MIVVRTMQSPDGVLGLNGFWYLEEDDGSLLKFSSEQLARSFIEDNGEDPDSEWIEYREENDIKDDLEREGYIGESNEQEEKAS